MTSGVKGPASEFPRIERIDGRPIQERLDLAVERLDEHRHMEVVAWPKSERGLGHGHANAVVGYVRRHLEEQPPASENRLLGEKPIVSAVVAEQLDSAIRTLGIHAESPQEFGGRVSVDRRDGLRGREVRVDHA